MRKHAGNSKPVDHDSIHSAFPNRRGPDHLSLTTTLSNLGVLYLTGGDYPEAASLLERAVAIRERTLGLENSNTAITLGHLGQVYEAQGRYLEAEPLFRKALGIQEKVSGPQHPAVASSLYQAGPPNLANLHLSQHRYTQEEPLFQRALAIREKSLGANHPSVAALLKQYAMFLGSTKRGLEAQALIARAQAILAVSNTEKPSASTAVPTPYPKALREEE